MADDEEQTQNGQMPEGDQDEVQNDEDVQAALAEDDEDEGANDTDDDSDEPADEESE
jgi:hypothetical protein